MNIDIKRNPDNTYSVYLPDPLLPGGKWLFWWSGSPRYIVDKARAEISAYRDIIRDHTDFCRKYPEYAAEYTAKMNQSTIRERITILEEMIQQLQAISPEA